ncbi:probable acyl-activating enzyme 16, chloroplastic isoform X1 [Gossypium arboreum]|uniref:AMP-dependent synthetase/ligase domain-containing protein n=1 Tax=Gossypium arboreum TaxID=29729 RepID=A0ABR0NFI2_GOSAR|nr:probable acyl-activating enzyme 16, chloroplastic isoform X1 [Gossypium arboreum]KAK5793775.1 hypothetical protein PVK06_034933 [Gossypium arboreum]
MLGTSINPIKPPSSSASWNCYYCSCETRMATLLSSTSSFDYYNHSLHFLFSPSKLHSPRILASKLPELSFPVFSPSKSRVFCESKTQEGQIRRCSPLLEKASLPSNGALASDEWKAVPDIWRSSAEKHGDRVAVVDPYHDPPSTMTYKQLEQEILDFTEGLRVIGVNPEEKVALFADNSCRWLAADQGIMAMGAINVVRGSRSAVEELLHIYNHSESVGLVVDNPEFFNRLAGTFSSKATMRFIVLLWGEKVCLSSGETHSVPIFSYKEIIELGRESRVAHIDSHDARQGCKYEIIGSDDIATIVYTSGTTGNPKGVMLTHKNLLHQIENLWDVVPTEAGDRFLSMLPTWHVYERACEYFTFTHGIEQVYTTVRNLKDDLRHYQPQYLISVPLVYETLYRGIQKQISTSSTIRKLIAVSFIRVSLAYMEFKRIYEGLYLTRNTEQPSYLASMLDCLWARIIAAILWPLHVLAKKLVYQKIHSSIGISKAGVNGGGSLPMHLDKFFEAIGVTVQNGYGLTESSPVVACRRPYCNVIGSIGHPIQHTEFKVVDSKTGEVLPPGTRGIVKVRGPQVMKGYYKNPLATKQALDEDGWLDTGDIGWIAPHHSVGRSRRCGGVIVLEGRAKDTIVLSSGENVEPLEIEEAAMRSSLIQQIVVVGQDQRRLAAIIVPNKDEVLQAAKVSSIVDPDAVDLGRDKMTSLLYEELSKWTSECSFQVGPILVVDEPFTIDSGLMTPTMKIRRDQVVAKYKEEIANLYK